MFDRTLYIEPTGGLCNRIRSIASAYKAAKNTGRRLTVIWKRDEGCNCGQTALFSLSDEISGMDLDPLNPDWTIKGKRMLFRWFSKLERGYFSNDRAREISMTHNVEEVIADKRHVYFESCYGLYGSEYSDLCKYDYSVIRVNEEILKGVVPAVKNEGNMIGVHIRRTDHGPSIRESTTESFIREMDRELKCAEGRCRFFLASDSREAKIEMIEHFGPELIVTRDVGLERSTEDGIKDAFIDLINLSCCKKVLGSYYSSFSEVAAAMGGIPLVECRSTEGV